MANGPEEQRVAVELPREVDFLLVPGFSMLALCSAIEPLRLANQLIGVTHYEWRHRTVDGKPARSCCGMTVPADAAADRSGREDQPQCLIVVSGFDPWRSVGGRLKTWLRALDRRGVLIGAVDTGAFLLAAADLLGGVRPVMHWESVDAFRELFPGVELGCGSHVIEGRRGYCVGGGAVLGMMIDLIGRTHGRDLAQQIARRLYVPVESAGDAPAARAEDPGLAPIMRLMEERIESATSIDEIAALAGLSRRTLERRFRSGLGQSPSEAFLHSRLDQGRRLLRHSDMPVQEVAIASGFASTSHFCRAYKRHFGVTPGSDRSLDSRLSGRDILMGRAGQAG